ncbi:sigma-54-dependent transcriptional regulator [Thermosulfuriphilus sp.]
MVKILLIEDDRDQRQMLADYLSLKGYEIKEAGCAQEGLDLLEWDPDVVLLDYLLPDKDGLSLLEDIKVKNPLSQVIVITAFGSIEKAVLAMRRGAFHYLTKPVNLEELLLLIDRALKEIRLVREVELLRQRLKELAVPEIPGIVAESQAMKEVLRLVSKVAATEATVLILGESGTGKEIVAGLLHRLSPRSKGPLVKINCAAIPEGLLESELFGYEKGAFTGASRSKPGFFELAHQGTIFLDEIGELPPALQAKLLRVLQEKTFSRIGGLKEISVDVRVVAATNQDLQRMVNEGRFREDLFWRLNVFAIRLPPLRQRKEDIVPLARHFLRSFAQKYGKDLRDLSREALEVLLVYEFPGNVRELENIIERAVILAEGPVVTLQDLPHHLAKGQVPKGLDRSLWELPLPLAVEHLERQRIKEALSLAKGVKTKAAEILGISERVLRYKLEKYGLS